jgi:Tfp pilus assembly protein PilF
VAAASIGLADVYRKQGKVSEAVELYREALSTAESFAMQEEGAKCLNGLGMCHLASDDLDRAQGLLQQSVQSTPIGRHRENRLRNLNIIFTKRKTR